jgi:hypothetical protein
LGTVLVEIPVDEATAKTLADPAMRRSAGLLLRHMATPIEGADPLATLLRAAYNEAPAPALTEEQVAEELATWKKERAARSE